jgi:FkbM family methyltransferase
MIRRRVSYVLIATDHGPMIVNRHDAYIQGNRGQGVGCQIMEHSAYEHDEVLSVLALLNVRRQSHGNGVVAIDCGANIGVHTIEMARHMTDWGEVIAYEPQEKVYYALCGNIAINNCFNARARWAAVSDGVGMIEMPLLDHQRPASFGGLSLRKDISQEDVGQKPNKTEFVRCVSLDTDGIERADFIKIDVEGMELEILRGARELIRAQRPIMLVEWIKTGKSALINYLAAIDYNVIEVGMNLLATHREEFLPAGAQQLDMAAA